MSTKSKKSRKGLAIGLAILGVAGLSLASASALNLGGTPQLQAGVKDVAGCQTSTIAVSFGAPTLVSGVYSSNTVKLASIDPTCANASYKIALLDSAGALLQESAVGTVPATGGATPVITLSTDASKVAKVAVTIYN